MEADDPERLTLSIVNNRPVPVKGVNKVLTEEIKLDYRLPNTDDIVPVGQSNFHPFYSSKFRIGNTVDWRSTWCISVAGHNGYLAFFAHLLDIDSSNKSQGSTISGEMTVFLLDRDRKVVDTAMTKRFNLDDPQYNTYGWNKFLEIGTLWMNKENSDSWKYLTFEIYFNIYKES